MLMVCEPMLLAKAMHKKGNTVYLYNFNQTLLDPIIESISGIKNLGVVHTSEFAYTNAHPNIFKDYGKSLVKQDSYWVNTDSTKAINPTRPKPIMHLRPAQAEAGRNSRTLDSLRPLMAAEKH